MQPLYPLLLRPSYKERIWGGVALETVYDEGLPPGPIGEAWLLGEHPEGTNEVINGPLAGATLTHLRRDFGAPLIGSLLAQHRHERLPLLVKLLDAGDDLSVQVHPADGYAGLPPGEPGKHEMWYVIAAEPGAQIVLGLRDGITREQFTVAASTGRIRDCLRYLPVAAGDLVDVPPGTVHALGAGLLVLEVQQSSDTTYRIYDYDRTGLDGKPRALHLEDALRVIQFDTARPPVRPCEPAPHCWQPLVHNEFFAADRAKLNGTWRLTTAPGTFEALIAVGEAGTIRWSGGECEMPAGHALLLPAALGAYELDGLGSVLRVRPTGFDR